VIIYLFFLSKLRKEADMNPSKESLSQDHFIEHFHSSSSVFPPLPFVDETLGTPPDQWVKGFHVLDPMLKKLRCQDLPGKEELEAYLRHQYRRHCRPQTIRGSFMSLEAFLKFFKARGKSCIEEIARDDLEGFVEHEQDRGLKLSTVRLRLAHLKAFLRFLIEEGVVHSDVFPWKLTIKMPETLPRAMDPEDVERLLAVKSSVRDRAMLLLLLRTGMRIGELLGTRVMDINMKEQKILLYESAKNRVGRVVYFGDDARDALAAWLKKRDIRNPYLFSARAGRPLTYTAARVVFRKQLKKAGLDEKGYTLHCLRHTYATELLNAGMSLECLEKLLGHSSLEVTRRYARLSDKTREEEYFKAMAIIERGEKDAHRQCDSELPPFPEATQLLPAHGEELHEHP
jgi:integrase/recombinase XerC/integrase/recombinase XerD